jgi:hypothetical protein
VPQLVGLRQAVGCEQLAQEGVLLARKQQEFLALQPTKNGDDLAVNLHIR